MISMFCRWLEALISPSLIVERWPDGTLKRIRPPPSFWRRLIGQGLAR